MVAKTPDEKAVFKVASQIQSLEARSNYLNQVCADDRRLFDRVVTLLRMDEEEPGFLEPAASGIAPTLDFAPIAERPGMTIGHYKLLQEIGEGGMGVVYLAEQKEPIQRKVALKVIKPGMDTRQVVARFEAERQALALMDHPNIAHVLDAGATDSGRPYFVMELVHGTPITEFCDRNDHTTRERLELFVQVCQAVQHAHQKGIIHRDIKPSNVMVTGDGERPVPKIIDFGVAKATGLRLTEKTVFTGHGQMVGTPLYMSPEQTELAGQDVDTRSDIYSLGMLLYELLTGTTPFDKQRLHDAGVDEFRRVIREEEAPRPSARISTLAGEAATTVSSHRKTDPAKLHRTLRRDLDWIVMKCLEKDRNRRYQTANALARDIQRHLTDEPIEARPPSILNRMGKWTRRHRTVAWSAAASVFAIVTVLVVSTYLLLGAYEEEKEQRAVAAANAAKAEENAARAAENYETAREAVRQMLTRVADEQLARIPEMKEVRRRLLEDAAAFYTKLIELSPLDSRAYYERGGVYFLLQRYEKVRPDLEKAIELDPDNAEFHHALGSFCLGCPDVAFRDLKCALLHTNWALRLDPQSFRYQHELAQLHFRSGEKKRAVDEMRRAAELCDTDARRATLHASACNMAGDVRGALEWQKKAVACAPDNPGLHEWLAKFYHAVGQYDNAVAAATEAIALGNKVRSESSDNLAFYRYVTRADVYAAMKMYHEALADYDRAVELGGFRSYTYKYRGLMHFRLGNYEKALADIAKAVELKPDETSALTWLPPAEVAKCPDEGLRKGLLELADKTVELTHGADAAYWAQAWLYINFGRAEELVAKLREAIRLKPHRAIPHALLGMALAQGGKLKEAIAEYRTAVRLDANTAWVHNSLAWQLATSADPRLRQPAEAVEVAKRAVVLSPNGSHLNTLGVAQYRAGDYQRAIESLQKSLALGHRALNSLFLAMCHWQVGRKDEARAWYDKSVEWMDKEPPRNMGEFRRFRAEAAELFGIPVQPPAGKEKTEKGK